MFGFLWMGLLTIWKVFFVSKFYSFTFIGLDYFLVMLSLVYQGEIINRVMKDCWKGWNRLIGLVIYIWLFDSVSNI